MDITNNYSTLETIDMSQIASSPRVIPVPENTINTQTVASSIDLGATWTMKDCQHEIQSQPMGQKRGSSCPASLYASVASSPVESSSFAMPEGSSYDAIGQEGQNQADSEYNMFTNFRQLTNQASWDMIDDIGSKDYFNDQCQSESSAYSSHNVSLTNLTLLPESLAMETQSSYFSSDHMLTGTTCTFNDTYEAMPAIPEEQACNKCGEPHQGLSTDTMEPTEGATAELNLDDDYLVSEILGMWDEDPSSNNITPMSQNTTDAQNFQPAPFEPSGPIEPLSNSEQSLTGNVPQLDCDLSASPVSHADQLPVDEFLLDILEKPMRENFLPDKVVRNEKIMKWIDKDNGYFQFLDQNAIVKLWGTVSCYDHFR